MLLSNLPLLFLGPFLALAWMPHNPTTCFIGKICAWDWGDTYTIYEAEPERSDFHQYPNPRLFEVSQEISPRLESPHNRIYTVTHFQLFTSGFNTNSCHLDFNIPCNSTVRIYHEGFPTVAVYSLTSFPGSAPTWNNILPLIGPKISTFSRFRRNTYEILDPEVCAGNKSVAFVYEVDQKVDRSASVAFNITLMNDDIIVGPFLNYTC